MDQMNTRMLQALVARGFFPQELPDVFATDSFGQSAERLYYKWRDEKIVQVRSINQQPYKRGHYKYKIKETEPERLTKPKLGYERRTLAIPHPIPQLTLCFEIAHNWRRIAKWLMRSKFSVDRVCISTNSQRATPPINFELHQAKKGFIEASSDWLVTTDITRFYPSIYTHSVAWAAYGKNQVKSDRARYDGSLADRIDQLLRICNRGQTVGIPIGPDTSHIIAEIISSRIDESFLHKLKDKSAGEIDRLQDDWFIGETSLEQSENILSILNQLYRDFELDINGQKTSINHTMQYAGEQWISEIKSFLSHRSEPLQGKRFREFLDLGVRLQARYPAKAVTKYVLSVIEGYNFADQDFEKLESFLLKAAVISPLSMDIIGRIIVNYSHFDKRISRDRITKRFTKLAEKNLENGCEFEAIWQIYTIRGMHARCDSSRIAELAEDYRGAIVPLILLDMKNRNLFRHKLSVDIWQDRISRESITSDSTWLLAFEGIRNGWLADRRNVMQTPFFRSLMDENVQFYDRSKNVKRSTAVKRRRFEERTIFGRMLRDAILRLRGFQYLPGSGS